MNCSAKYAEGIHMNNIIKMILMFINGVTSFGVVVFLVFGIYEAIMGPQDAEKLLKKLKIEISYRQVLVIGLSCVAIMVVTCNLLG